ncbi:MAG: CDP-diacylglycerol--serine O-phosphatidyltransferase [Nitrospirae bacterium]|nr:CDP-diacylglycerol--serine O-phosphatidyltransferase [Nitrospirota bacterium]MBI3351710.1 CDP-diacylglycerol--serine O-phosphatidyltransferase [Nitrospirota bacterium]
MIKMTKVKQKGVYLIPNLFTTGNIFSGFYAIISIFNAEYLMAAYAILAATIFDTLDGKAARLANATSRFGTEYDSLADLISFGLAPGLLIYSWALHSYNRLGWIAAFLFVVCGALRLARFNVQSTVSDPRYFTGLPIPAAASTVAMMVILDNHILRLGSEVKPVLILVMTYALAFLMVSNIKYRSFKDINLNSKRSFQYLVWAILIFVVIVLEPHIMLFSIVVLYALSGPISRPFRAVFSRASTKKEEIDSDEEFDDFDEEQIHHPHR